MTFFTTESEIVSDHLLISVTIQLQQKIPQCSKTTFCEWNKATTEQLIEFELNLHDRLSKIAIDDPDSQCNIHVDALFEQIRFARVLASDAAITKREFRPYLKP